MRPVVVLFLVASLPVSLRSQGGIPTATNGTAITVASPQAAGALKDLSLPPTTASSTTSDPGAEAPAPGAQQSKSPSQQQPKPNKPKPSPDQDRPPGDASMVGYIDDAIVSSQIRVRFDAGFDDNRPDRAEFFYAACGCNGFPAAGPQPGAALHLNFQQLYMRGEYAPVKRFSVFAEIPIRWIQPQQFAFATVQPPTVPFGNQAGLSDVQAGFKFAVLASSKHYLTFQLGATFPSGDSSKGLGTAHYSIEPSLLYFQKIGGTQAFQGDLAGFQGDVFTYGLGPSYTVYKGEKFRVAPVLELVGWRVLGGRETNGDLLASIPVLTNPVVSSDGVNIVNLKAGIRTSIGNHNSFYAGFGQALTHEMWYKHIVRLEYRYSF
jgi:hypothetical protein